MSGNPDDAPEATHASVPARRVSAGRPRLARIGETYRFTSRVYRWDERANDSWYFVDVPAEESDEIRDRPRMPRGFGSVRVEATIGGTTWRTSIFPGADRYALPLKKAVRTTEGIEPDDEVRVRIETLD